VVTANNRQVAGAIADRISTEWEAPFRAARIRQLLAGARDVTAEQLHAMQLDVRDAHAERYRDRAIQAARSAGLTAAAATLSEWNLEARASSPAAALYYAWFLRLRTELARALHGDTAGYLPRRVADAALERRALPWRSDPGARAAFDSASASAMRSASHLAAGRTWGQLHSLRIEHALASIPVLPELLRLNLGQSAANGSETTVNVLHPADRDIPSVAVYGASQRHVVDMADVDGSGGFILPTGQSGLFYEPHYRDQFRRWRKGGLWLIPLNLHQAEARAVHHLRLEPD
jgi:penicillin amidase